GTLKSVRILPVDVRYAPRPAGRAAISDERRSLLSYLPPDTVLIRVAGETDEGDWGRTWTEVLRLFEAERRAGANPEPPSQVFSPPAEVVAEIEKFPTILVGAGSDAKTGVERI